MTKEDRKIWKAFKANQSITISKGDVKVIETLHAKYFNHRPQKLCSCNPKQAQRWIDELNNIYTESTPKRNG